MKDLGKIIRINLLVLLGYSLIFLLITFADSGSGGDTYKGMGFLIFMMIFIILQAVVNLILMIVKFVRGEKEVGVSYLISVFVVAIVGFSSCFGGAELLG